MAGLFGGGDVPAAPAPMPVPEPPKPTPMADETKLAKKKKQALLASQSRGGRQSTLLSQYGESETLGS